MSKSNRSRRNNKPEKPYPDFPLFPHAALENEVQRACVGFRYGYDAGPIDRPVR
jgi:hypothetical protein